MPSTPGKVQLHAQAFSERTGQALFLQHRHQLYFPELPFLGQRPFKSGNIGQATDHRHFPLRQSAMEQDHAQIQEQIDHRGRALERTALGKCRQIAFQPVGALHQPSHGSCGSTQQQGDHVEQQPGTFGQDCPTTLGI
ncbi:hypothetical protein D9M71_728440 [compost metagenome]